MKQLRVAVAALAVVAMTTLATPFGAAAAAPPGAGRPAVTGIEAPGAPADVDDFEFESFDGEYFLDVDDRGHSTMRVVETIVAIFPEFDQNRGIIRAIPMTYLEAPLDVTMVSITDENGDSVYFERHDYEGFAEFWLGTDEFVHGRTTYVLEYTMRNVVGHFADSGGDEFYWDINGDGWQQPFGSVTATIHLAEPYVEALTGDAVCFLGYYGGTDPCQLEQDGDTFRAEVGPVGVYNTMTVAIGFDGGTVVQPVLPRDSWIIQIVPKVLLGLAALWVVLAFVFRFGVWRDARGRGTIIAQFEPPEGEDLLLDAELLGRNAVGLPALFVDFAVRGLVRVIDTDPGASGSGSRRFELELVTKDGATDRERAVLVSLFEKSLKPGKRVNLGSLNRSTGASLYGQQAKAAAYAVAQDYRGKPPGSATVAKVLRRLALWTVLAFVPIWVWAIWYEVLEGEVIGPSFGALMLGLVVPFVVAVPARLTAKGALAKEYLLGLREYLTVAEEQRMRMLQSPEGALRVNADDRGAVVKLDERLLPYAVLWGVEDRWMDVLRAEWASEAPTWLATSDLSGTMLRSFASASTSSVRPIVTSSSSGGSSWSSSGSSSFSSGSSGGGFSGGGGGGGGGGGR